MKITIQGAVAALNAAKEAIKGNTVSPEILIQRVSVCSVCPKRRVVSGTLTRVGKILADLANKHAVPREVRNYKCGVCSCPLSLLVTALPENLHKDSPAEAKVRPLTCWMKNP